MHACTHLVVPIDTTDFILGPMCENVSGNKLLECFGVLLVVTIEECSLPFQFELLDCGFEFVQVLDHGLPLLDFLLVLLLESFEISIPMCQGG